MDQERPWAARAAFAIGERIALYRDMRGLSAQQLADRCASLGMDSISRVVITKLENKRREAVSAAEIQVLAKALEVPPLLLLFPVGLEPSMEVLPGVSASPWDAAAWFKGESANPADRFSDQGVSEVADSAVNLFGLHDDAEARWERTRQGAEDSRRHAMAAAANPAPDRSDVVDLMLHAAQADEHWHNQVTEEIRGIRARIRSQGLVPPPLRMPGLAASLGETAEQSEAVRDGSR